MEILVIASLVVLGLLVMRATVAAERVSRRATVYVGTPADIMPRGMYFTSCK